MTEGSKIFSPFRALGYVSNHIPLVTRYHKRHKDNYVITCVGKAFHVYNVSKLGIVSVSDIHPEDISALSADDRYVFTSAGKCVFALDRNKKITKRFEGHNADVSFLLSFGRHLISVDSDGFLIVWSVATEEKYLETKFDPESFLVTAIAHPHTYVNKVLLGSHQGTLQLWNIRTNRLVYSFEGWGSGVTAVQQSTAVDVMAIGLSDGHVILHNLALDKTVMKLKQEYGPVISIGFRSDGHPMMVSGSSSGHIALWDLENRKLHSYMKNAHNASVTGLACLPSEPLMVTSAPDNSLKVWIFDLADSGARLLHFREGHSAPPTFIRFYRNDGQNILTAGQDSTMRSFSTIHEQHNKSLGRASFYKKKSRKLGLVRDKYKMPPIVKFVAESSKESDWDNILACHRGLDHVTTWSYQRGTMGNHRFSHTRFSQDVGQDSAVATAVDISSCGNFGVIGYSTGHLDLYNMQSGIERGSFGNPAHSCTVRGVCIDALNQKVVSAGSEGLLRFWRFKGKQLLGQTKMESFISQILLHRESSLLAVSLDDFTVKVVDTDTRKVVRSFTGHSGPVSDMSFSADGRWLITASMDCSIRTWYLPTGRLIDAFAVISAPTSISMSPCGNFLSSTHVGDVGIYLWSNKTLYSHVSLPPLPDSFEPQLLELPGTSSIQSDDSKEWTVTADEDSEYKSVEQISDELVTLSLLPTSRWLNLLNLDIIKMRNKPKEPPKAPKSAPFFLPTVAGLETKFDIKPDEDENTRSRLKVPEFGGLSELSVLLSTAHKENNYTSVLDRLKAMGPSAIDAGVRSLSEGQGGSDKILGYFIDFVNTTLHTNRDFELIHSYLALFLKVYGDQIISKPDLVEGLEKLKSCEMESWERLQTLLHKSLGLITYLRSATL